MVHVDKPAEIPEILRNSTEAKSIIAYHTSKKKKGKKPDYQDYKSVKDDLIKIFKGKCGYCESNTIVTSSGDIEHFRPKNEVLNDKGETVLGYYWLGADWDNLILSCELCNRKRYHEIETEEDKVALGKQNQFPLTSETHRCKYGQDWKDEEHHRLLLHPCLDPDPSKHLEFREDGVVRPAVIDGAESEMGKATIQVVALHRVPLVEARKQHYLDKIKLKVSQLQSLERTYQDKAATNPEWAESCKSQMKEILTYLKDLLNPKAEYLAMSRQLLHPILSTYQIFI